MLEHRVEHGVGRGDVEVPGGFVEKQDGAVGQHGPGHAETLEFPAGDRVAPGREDGIGALLQPVQPQPRRSCRRRSVICRSAARGAPTRRFARREAGNSVGCSGLQASKALTSSGERASVPSMLN